MMFKDMILVYVDMSKKIDYLPLFVITIICNSDAINRRWFLSLDAQKIILVHSHMTKNFFSHNTCESTHSCEFSHYLRVKIWF